MASSVFPTITTGVTVETATNSNLSGDGSSGNKLTLIADPEITGNLTVDGNALVSGTVAAAVVGADVVALVELRPSATPFASLPVSPAQGEQALIDDCTVTSGTISIGGGVHKNWAIYTGSLWTVLKNLT